MKVPRVQKSKKENDTELTLHSRIDRYASLDPEAANLLFAVKWVGNTASHSQATNIKREAILDVFDLFDFVLEEHYHGRTKKLKQIADAINNAKGLPKGKKKLT